MKRFFNHLKHSSFVIRRLQNGIIIAIAVLLIIGCVTYIPSVFSVSLAVQTYDLPITSIHTDKQILSLTFDATGTNEQISEILSILDKYNIHATFFVTGEWVSSYPDDVKTISLAGHDIGNYSQSYSEMNELSKEKIQYEISQLHTTIKQLTGTDMTLFRPPYGSYNSFLISCAKQLNYNTIQWNIDSLDWKGYRTDCIIDTVVNHKNLSNGSIILFHNDGKYTKNALEIIIQTLQKKGFSFVPVSKLIESSSSYEVISY